MEQKDKIRSFTTRSIKGSILEKIEECIKNNDIILSQYTEYINAMKINEGINIKYLICIFENHKKIKYKHVKTGELFDKSIWENGQCMAPASTEDSYFDGTKNVELIVVLEGEPSFKTNTEMWNYERKLQDTFLKYAEKQKILELSFVNQVHLTWSFETELNKGIFLKNNVKKIEKHIIELFPEVSGIYCSNGLGIHINNHGLAGWYNDPYIAEKYFHNRSREIKIEIFNFIQQIDNGKDLFKTQEDLYFHFCSGDYSNGRDSIMYLEE